jgi:hypothetical protein
VQALADAPRRSGFADLVAPFGPPGSIAFR